MKSLILILSLICTICAIILPIWAMCITLKEGYSNGIVFYVTTIACCFSGGLISIIWKAIKEEFFE